MMDQMFDDCNLQSFVAIFFIIIFKEFLTAKRFCDTEDFYSIFVAIFYT